MSGGAEHAVELAAAEVPISGRCKMAFGTRDADFHSGAGDALAVPGTRQCGRRINAERLPALAAPFARRTARFAGIVEAVWTQHRWTTIQSDCQLASACQ